MRDIQLDIRLPFSYYLQAEPDRGWPLFRPDAGLVNTYALALAKELESLAGDVGDVCVASIFFSGGYLSLLSAEQFRSLLGVIRRSFKVSEGARIAGCLFPGSLDLSLISEYKNEAVAPLMFDIPTLLPRECEVAGLPNVLLALDKTRYFLESTAFPHFGFRFYPGIQGRSADAWEAIAGQIVHYGPPLLEFLTPEALWVEDPWWPSFTARLHALGYCPVSSLRWSLGRADTAFVWADDREQLGAGLSAETRLDGFKTRNTDDLKRYLELSSNYRDLITEVSEMTTPASS